MRDCVTTAETAEDSRGKRWLVANCQPVALMGNAHLLTAFESSFGSI
jgi:hypothetical protein